MTQKVIVAIPAYNEQSTIVGVIRGLKARGFPTIIVVDDGSSDPTGELATREGVLLVRHVINRGLGGALETGIRAAIERGADIIVTFDADGQHNPDDIARLIAPIEAGDADVVIGSRTFDTAGMPRARQIANRIANLVTYILFEVRATDSQSGLRAFSRAAATQIHLTTSGMEGSSEILAEVVDKRLRYTEVPIKAIYTEYSMSKGQNFRLGLQTLMKLVIARARRPAARRATV